MKISGKVLIRGDHDIPLKTALDFLKEESILTLIQRPILRVIVYDTMDSKETSLKTNTKYIMLENTEYYKYIFKKTEKIACAVYYVLRNDRSIRQDDSVVVDLEMVSKELLDSTLESLKTSERDVAMQALEIQHHLMVLESKLRVAHAAHVVDSAVLDVFLREIDSTHRTLRQYIHKDIPNPILTESSGYPSYGTGKHDRLTKQSRIVTSGQKLMNGTAGMEPQRSRREQVIQVLRDKGQATIKDVIEVVKDCSEKTIQRELTSLIKDSLVRREGERRWSKYILI